MIRIAIVEDDQKFQKRIFEFLDQYSEESKEIFDKTFFSDGYDIADDYKGAWDIILMDIEMNLMNGMEAAEKIRQRDEQVIIIFITNMAQYAIRGYAVNAFDYILKPLSYFAFSQTLMKAIRRVPKENSYVTISTRDGTFKVRTADLYWIESRGHRLTFHTECKDYETTIYSMKEMEKKLRAQGFSRCNTGFLVNLNKTDGVQSGNVLIGNTTIAISRGRRNAFLSDMSKYMI